MSKSNLLIDETPIVFQPTLAKLIGLHEAIVLQTLKYWCGQKRCGKVVDDERWIFNTAEQWREFSFPFWSTRTIGEIFRTLESMGLIKSKQFDLQSGKAMKYYTISQSALTILTSERADQLEDSSEPIWKILPDHLEDSSRSARARHIKEYTEKHTEKQKPLTPFQGEEESSAMASRSSDDETNSKLEFKTEKTSENTQLFSYAQNSPVKKTRQPKLADDAFIAKLKEANPRVDFDTELRKMDNWLISRPTRKKTRAFVTNWINRVVDKLPQKEERFNDF